jgi:protein gp37
MADGTKIEWTDATWNPVTGCTVLTPGCTNCYAMRLAGTRMKHHPSRQDLTIDTKAGPVWNGQVRFNEEWLHQPLRWSKPRMVFVCAHGDLFHDDVPDAWIDRVFAVMALSPQHTFQVLTKRADRMRAYMADPMIVRRVCTIAAKLRYDVTPDPDKRRRAFHKLMDQSARLTAWTHPGGAAAGLFARNEPGRDYPSWIGWPLPNVWLGVSVEDQARADERIPHLLDTLAAVRFISAEPLLGPIDLRHIAPTETGYINALCSSTGPNLDQVIAGGESGPNARPVHPDWARSLRDQCAAADVAFFFKQWGEWAPGENVERATGIVETADWFDGRWTLGRENLADNEGHVDDEPDVYRIGKKRAGALLDGREHREFPR